jgi:transcriptional regulator GlxA family with amidase domain
MPPYRWLRAVRVERAKDLLFNSSLSLSQIAYECGFSDQSHLTRVFSDSIGITPGAWRKARRGSNGLIRAPIRSSTLAGLALAAG